MNWKFWKSNKRKSKTREWIDALVFAVVAATIIRTFLIEAFTIPTPSMEKSLLVGDFLFVSKMSYGARTPMTPISFPFVHQELPIIGGKSYSDAIQWGYHRLPGFGKVKNNDVVVFNYPGNTFYPDEVFHLAVNFVHVSSNPRNPRRCHPPTWPARSPRRTGRQFQLGGCGIRRKSQQPSCL